MILGYGIIAIPTGIVSVEYSNQKDIDVNTKSCHNCGAEHHNDQAIFCHNCGHNLEND